MKIKKYQKKFDFSYAFGTYPVIDLLENHPHEVIEVLISDEGKDSEGVDRVIHLCEKGGVQMIFSDRKIEKIAFKENTYVVGVFRKYECNISKDRDHLVLVEPRNMGNLGTIIRTMLGFDFRDLVLVGNCADIFDPKVVRSTMGALFRIKFKEYEDIDSYIGDCPNHSLYPFMLDGGKDIRDVEFRSPFSLIQGNESRGLDCSFKGLGESVYIPHTEGIDSLNLAIATGIGLWEVRRKQRE